MAMTELKLELKKAFEMTDCGELHHFLGISITRDRSKRLMTLDQSHLANQVLKRHSIQDCKPISMPLDPGIKLAPRIEGERGSSNSNSNPMNEINSDPKNPETPVDATAYRQIIGSLMFLMTGTRPDLAVAIGFLSQFNANPTNAHMQAAKRTLRYLKGTKDAKLCFNGNNDGNQGITLIGYCDANWGNDTATRKSTTGYLFHLCGALITWSSKRQATVALSSTEAEYMALTHATKEAIWLRTLLSELSFMQRSATIIHEDNQSSIALARNPVHHARTKHIDIQYHFIREKVDSKEIELIYLPTDDMHADTLTKPLPFPKFAKFRHAMGIRHAHSEKSENSEKSEKPE